MATLKERVASGEVKVVFYQRVGPYVGVYWAVPSPKKPKS